MGMMLFFCQKTYKGDHTKENSMSVEANGIKAVFIVTNPKLSSERDLEFKMSFTNISDSPIKINSLLFSYATIMLKARKADGTPLPPGPPPFPPEDNGIDGRVTLQPGKSQDFTFFGYDYFGVTLGEGKYQIRFSYTSTDNTHGDWVGSIESPWMNFEIISGHSLLQGKKEHPLFGAIAQKIGFLVYDMRLLEEHVKDAVSMLMDKNDRGKGYDYIKNFSVAEKISVFIELTESFLKERQWNAPEYLENRGPILHDICVRNEEFFIEFWALFRVHRTQIGSMADPLIDECKAFESRLESHLDTIDREFLMLSSFIQKELREKIYV
jgi:hypothetical protein